MRLRELGIKIGTRTPGRYNAITDVEGVAVGQTELVGPSINAFALFIIKFLFKV